MKSELTLGSLFDGSGGFVLGALINGITPVWSSEIEPFPIRVTTKRLPQVRHYGDITKLDGKKLEPVDVITFGSPCFPKGTLVLTSKGLREIENIHIGDMVLTHMGRWRKVTAMGSKMASTIRLKGHHYGLVCTRNHPIYTRQDNLYEWIAAEDMLHRMWGVPNKIQYLPIPRKECENSRMKPMPEFSEGFFYFVGRWLGDGWVRDAQRKGRPENQRFATIYLCDSVDKAEELKSVISCISERYSLEYGNTCVKIKCNSRLLCDWLTENFGKYAYGKEIPSWCFSMQESYRRALLKGIEESDGYRKKHSLRVTTVSKKLAFGIRILAETLGYSTTVYSDVRPATYNIEGRTVSQRDTYITEIFDNGSRQSDDTTSWYKVISIADESPEDEVYNLSVDEDNSYTADGIIVHNCQDMSLAGKRTGLNGSRSCLFFEAARIVREMREATDGRYPRFIVWENVFGAFSSNRGEDFRAVLDNIVKIRNPQAPQVPMPEDGKWPYADILMGEGWSIAYRTFDAQHWGVPQRRRRIYLVADFADRSAGKILFESEGVSGYSAEGFRSWQRAAGSLEEGIRASSLCLNDQGGNRMDVTEGITATLRATSNHPPLVFEKHSRDARYKGPLDLAPALLSTYGNGGNNQPFVLEDQKCFDVRFTSEGTRNARQNCYETETSRTIDTGGNMPDSNQGGVAVVAYGICSKGSHAMQSDNPHSGFYKADTARCLDVNGGNPACNQGGIAVIEGNGSRPSHKGDGYKESEIMYTLNATEQHGVAYGIDRSAFNQGENAKFGFSVDTEVEPPMAARGAGAVAQPTYCTSKNSHHTIAEKELANTLVATDYKDPPVINGSAPEYIVRRLTPVECARLQGFPDWWCDGLGTDNPTDEEIAWWTEVFQTRARVMGKSTKPKSRNQIVKWLKEPYSDVAAYKMWGNGVALPCVYFVMVGIVHAALLQQP